MRALIQRSDHPAIRDTLLWFALLVIFGTGGVMLSGSILALPCFLCYGVLYGSASDSRWHECGHRSAFKTRWMNNAVYQIACFMILREPEIWRWSHARHHADTIIVGRDPEIVAERPPNLLKLVLSFVGLPAALTTFRKLFAHALGRIEADERTYVPEAEWPRVVRTARVWLLIHAGVIGIAIVLQSWIPALLVGVLPFLYGTWLSVYFGITQHLGLAEDMLDHRLCARTVRMNPVFRFIYWNMNYHVEHHMFPMVPFHALPQLHEAVRDDMPVPCRSTLAAYLEIIPALLRQRREPAYTVRRPLPPGATPYPAPVPAE
jgi:fatty acid desaturase